MENHGPLHLESVAKGDEERLYACAPPAGHEEFTIYLRHLQHTDVMLGEIHAAINATARGGWLCAYGDHVPILPGVYGANQFADGRTDYVIVGPTGTPIDAHEYDVAPENLALDLLCSAGLAERVTAKPVVAATSPS